MVAELHEIGSNIKSKFSSNDYNYTLQSVGTDRSIIFELQDNKSKLILIFGNLLHAFQKPLNRV